MGKEKLDEIQQEFISLYQSYVDGSITYDQYKEMKKGVVSKLMEVVSVGYKTSSVPQESC